MVFMIACSSTRDSEIRNQTTNPEYWSDKTSVKLLDNLGGYHHAITTQSPAAQRYFDQGMVMSFAFNHSESVRAFRAAQQMDEHCAMCYWGEALALGPNINVTNNGRFIVTRIAFASI